MTTSLLRNIDELKAKASRLEVATAETWDEETYSIEVVGYSGTPVSRRSGEDGEFELSFDMQGADLSRWNAGAAVLRDHMAYTDYQVGKIMEGTARIENGRLRARVQLSRDPALAAFVEDVRSGMRKNLSMGTRLTELVTLAKKGVAGAEKTRVMATKWSPYELSFVPVGADPNAQTLAQENDPMPTAAEMEQALANAKAEGERLANERHAAEQARRDAILAMAPAFVNFGGDKADVEKLAADKTITVEAARKVLFEQASALQAAARVNPARGIELTKDNDNDGRVMTVAFALKMGVSGDWLKKRSPKNAEFVDRASELQNGLNIVRLCERELNAQGVKTANLTGEQMYDRYMARSAPRRAEAMNLYDETYDSRALLGEVPTSALPVIATGAQRIALVFGYETAPSTFEAWTRTVDMDDFRAMPVVDLSRFPMLRELGETGRPEHGSVVESSNEISLKEFGRQIGFSRRLMINNQINVMGEVSQSTGAMIRLMKNRLAYKLLGGTPAAGSTTLFTGTRLVATAAPSIASLDALANAIAEQEMLAEAGAPTAEKQYFPWPMTLVVAPFALRTKIDQLLGANASTYLAQGVTGNDGVRPTWMNGITPVVDKELDRQQGNGVAFYGFASPSARSAFVCSQLAGEAMNVQTVEDPETLGTKLIVRVAWNVQAVSHLGVAKVAAS